MTHDEYVKRRDEISDTNGVYPHLIKEAIDQLVLDVIATPRWDGYADVILHGDVYSRNEVLGLFNSHWRWLQLEQDKVVEGDTE